VLLWKGYYAGCRGWHTYRRDRREHDSLREYLLANGATRQQALRPFVRHALQRALLPLVRQWRLWLVVLALAVAAAAC
jgi:ABC-type iron transport system FetAB permease component